MVDKVDSELIEQFGDAVNNEIITITIGPPKRKNNEYISRLRVYHHVLNEYVDYFIPLYEVIGWYSIAQELRDNEWL